MPDTEYTEESISDVGQKMEDFFEDMKNLVRQNTELQVQLRNLELDLDDEKKRRRDLQLSLKEMGKNKPTKYNVMLIDGDGMIFSSSLLAKGDDGGREAASMLREYFPSDEPTHIRVYAYLDGLSSALVRAGLAPDIQTVRKFFQGFSDSCNKHCYFIDVGDGKEKADKKLACDLEWHLKDTGGGCQTVVLGASADNGYARLLDELSEHLQKVQLLQGPPFGREYKRFIDRRVHNFVIPGLFEPAKIDATSSSSNNSSSMGPPATSSVTSGVSYAGITTANFPPLPKGAPLVLGSTPPPSPPVQKASLPTTIHSSVKGKTGKIMYSAETFSKMRNLTPRPCNNHYLRKDGCWYGEICVHNHKYKFTKEETAALRCYVKNLACKNAMDCPDADCLFGHPSGWGK